MILPPKKPAEHAPTYALVDKLIVGYKGRYKDPRYVMTTGEFAYLGDKGEVYRAVVGSGKPTTIPTAREDIEKKVRRMQLSVSDVLTMLEEEHKLIAKTSVIRREVQKEAYLPTLKARAIYEVQNRR